MPEIDLHRYHSDLLDKFQSAEETGHEARKKAERDIDYYDNKQWTDKEVKELKRRGQPPITQNLTKQKIDFLLGLERTQRTVPNGLPRTPKHEEDAHAATDAIRYVADANRYDALRSDCWADLLKAGWCGVEVVAEKDTSRSELMTSSAMKPPEWKVIIRRNAWDRMFWDPYSAAGDFSDAGYLGLVIWMDRQEAVRRYGEEAGKVFDETVSAHSAGETFDDKPHEAWVQHGKRKRVRVVQMYFINDDDGEWDFCEFTRGGILQAGPSPWVTEDGRREHPYSWQSAHVDRDNNRYGIIRELIDLQDEINKRRSKALHHFTTRQTFGNERAFGKMSARDVRAEMAKPDGHIPLIAEAQFGKDFGIIPTNDQAAGHFDLMQQATSAFEVMGPNAAMQGKKEGNESGRAIMAQQQGGAIQMGTLTDTLRDMDLECYRKAWRRIRHHWREETWVRVTDDEKNMKFVGLNEPMGEEVVDPMTGQVNIVDAIDPQTGQPMLNHAVSELDLDIEIDEAPDMGTLQAEEFANLVDLARIGVVFPPKVYLMASNLRNKGDLIRMMEEQQQPPPPDPALEAAQRLELEGKQADNAKTAAEVEKIKSETAGKAIEAQLMPLEALAQNAPPVQPQF